MRSRYSINKEIKEDVIKEEKLEMMSGGEIEVKK